MPEESFNNDEEVEVEDNGISSTQRASTKGPKLKATFGRRRTHNEQLIMRTCGVTIARATFYGSEARSAVLVSELLFSIVIYLELYKYFLAICQSNISYIQVNS